MIPPVVDLDFLDVHPQAIIVDSRWYLDGRSGRDAYEAGHLPGAVFADVDTDLAATDLPPTEGRHPLPTAEAFAATMRRLGIGDESIVVSYDDCGGVIAGRLAVMLRMLGRHAAILDGGLATWVEAGRPLEPGPGAERQPAAFTATEWPGERLASVDQTVAAAAAGLPVIDARSAERFAGRVAMVDKRPGHIPGARSAPATAVLGPNGRLRSIGQLRAHYAAVGITTDSAGSAIASCGSGVSACLNIIAIEHAGMTPPRLFVASWSGYSADPQRPAELSPNEQP